MNSRGAITKINKRGVLLVFPVNNAPEPNSLWAEAFPNKKMRWEWDDSGDNRVADMWRLMKQLSDSGDVVYSKWYQGRATFFSRDIFAALLCLYGKSDKTQLSRQARDILDMLEESSPRSTKEIKKQTELQGKDNEKHYQRAMKELFSKFLIVGYGEVDDGAFPSLAVASTQIIYEDLWRASRGMSQTAARAVLNEFLPEDSKFGKFLKKSLSQ